MGLVHIFEAEQFFLDVAVLMAGEAALFFQVEFGELELRGFSVDIPFELAYRESIVNGRCGVFHDPLLILEAAELF